MKFIFALGLFAFFLAACTGSSSGGDKVNPSPSAPSPEVIENNTAYGKSCDSFKMSSGSTLNYCIWESDPSSKSKNLVYFLPGLGGKASDIFQYFGSNMTDSRIENLRFGWNGERWAAIVFLSFGPNETVPPDLDANETIQELLTTALPKIEAKLTSLKDRSTVRRHLLGLSLGGFNALNLASHSRGFFKSTIALCPALLNFNPFDPAEVEAYLSRNPRNIDPKLVQYMIASLQNKFQTPQKWTDWNPIEGAKKGLFRDLELFVSTGNSDEYGFYEGAWAFVKASADQGDYWGPQGSRFAPTSGGHCSFDAADLNRFLNEHF